MNPFDYINVNIFTSIAICNSSLISRKEPTSSHVTSGTVAKPSLLADGWIIRRAVSKSLCSIHKFDNCSVGSGGSLRNQVSNPVKSGDLEFSCITSISKVVWELSDLGTFWSEVDGSIVTSSTKLPEFSKFSVFFSITVLFSGISEDLLSGTDFKFSSILKI